MRLSAKTLILPAAALTVLLTAFSRKPVYLDDTRPLEARVEDALSRMTLEEKVALLHAQSKFSSAGVRRLGIPELWCTDGPHGIRPEVLWDEWRQAGWTSDSCVAYPALTCLAATWNEEMAALFGKSVGEEARYREKDVLLGPGVNIYRTPLNGRNFEYMGEDPFLASRLVVPYVRGVQENGVAACVKHFALNNQEANRHAYEAVVDDRTLHEIYLPAFKAAVQEGGAWAVMGSYNKYKGEFCCHNRYLLNDILKGNWGYDGVVISDWGGTEDTGQAISNGLDLEFGTGTDGMTTGWNGYDAYHLAGPYLERLRSGEASEEVLNDKVRRVLRLIFRTAMNREKPFGSLCSPEHDAAARKIASEGIVLLKNDGAVLPLDHRCVRRIAVVGENALKRLTVGGGSSSLKVRHECTPLEGLTAAAGDSVQIVYERGYVGDVTGFLDGVSTGQDLRESRSAEQLVSDAVKAASEADAVIFVGGLNKAHGNDSEGSDRLSLSLPYGQDSLIEALAGANPNLAVVLVSGNAVAMPWVETVPAIVQAWYLGSQAGYALADVLFGNVNPSGKLPFTFPVRLEDNGAHATVSYSAESLTANYAEGIYVGYRRAEKYAVKPLFAFGHGLSYTEFSYGQARTSGKTMRVPDSRTALKDSDIRVGAKSRPALSVSVPVTNSGSVTGKETVQFYVGFDEPLPPSENVADRPMKELKGFRKVELAPGETRTVTVEIRPDDLRRYDASLSRWVLDKGRYTVHVGSASDDIRTTVSFEVR